MCGVIIISPLEGVHRGMTHRQTFSSLCFSIRHFRRFANCLSVWSSLFAISCYWTGLLWIVTTGTEIIWSISIAIRIVHFINFVTKTQVIGLIFFRSWYNLNIKFMNNSSIIILDGRENRKMIIYGIRVYRKLILHSLYNIKSLITGRNHM